MTASVTIVIRVRPGASREAVGGAYGDPPALVVAVTVRAVDGRATAAALAALAEAIGVKERSLTLVGGASHRTKVVRVDDPPEDLAERMEALRGARGAPS